MTRRRDCADGRASSAQERASSQFAVGRAADDAGRPRTMAVPEPPRAVSSSDELAAHEGMQLAAQYVQLLAAGETEAAATMLNTAGLTQLRWIAACLGAEVQSLVLRQVHGDHGLLRAAFRNAPGRASEMSVVHSAELVLRHAEHRAS